MLTELVSWWLRQMSEVATLCFRLPPKGASDGLLIVVDPSASGDPAAPAIELRRRRRRRIAVLGRFVLDDHGMAAARVVLTGRAAGEPVVLAVPARQVLVREIVLPLAAERDADNALRYDMDRLTPFTAEELFWSWVVHCRDRARGQLILRLALAPKAQLQPVLGPLAELGLLPMTLEPADGAPWTSIPLVTPDSSQLARRRLALRAAVAIPASLAAVVLLMPMLRQSFALAAADARVETLRPLVAEAEALRLGITATATGAGGIVSARLHSADALHVLSTLTDLLPDDTYLTGLTLNHRKLAIDGQSAAATKLIGALSTDPTIRNPSFAAPVTRTDNQTEIFSIQAEFGS